MLVERHTTCDAEGTSLLSSNQVPVQPTALFLICAPLLVKTLIISGTRALERAHELVGP